VGCDEGASYNPWLCPDSVSSVSLRVNLGILMMIASPAMMSHDKVNFTVNSSGVCKSANVCCASNTMLVSTKAWAFGSMLDSSSAIIASRSAGIILLQRAFFSVSAFGS